MSQHRPAPISRCDDESDRIVPHMVICLGQSLLNGGCIPPALTLRVEHAAGIYRQLSAMPGAASLYVSGADVKGGGTLQPEGQVMFDLLQKIGVDAAGIDVDIEARNTIENAQNAIAPMRRRGAGIVTLVTSDFHMPRATYIFKTVFAAEAPDIQLIVNPAPSGLATGPPRSGKRPREINDWSFLERVEHEAGLMQERMVPWLQSYGYQSDPEHTGEALRSLDSLSKRGGTQEHLTGKFRIWSFCSKPLYHPLNGAYRIDEYRDPALIWKSDFVPHTNQVWTFEPVPGKADKYRILSHRGKPLYRPLPGCYQHDDSRVYALVWNGEVSMHENQVWTLEPVVGKKSSYRILSFDGKPLYHPLNGFGRVDEHRDHSFLPACDVGAHENQVWTLEAVSEARPVLTGGTLGEDKHHVDD